MYNVRVEKISAYFSHLQSVKFLVVTYLIFFLKTFLEMKRMVIYRVVLLFYLINAMHVIQFMRFMF